MSAVIESQAPELSGPMRVLMDAISNPATDMAKLEKFLELQQRWQADQARMAFVAAMAALKADPISIVKSKEVNIPGGARFRHATLADVVDGAVAAMSRHGLSHNWRTEQNALGITVTCLVRHEAGHSESTVLTAPPDESGKKNTIQQIGSTVTYLQRYTLMAALGLAAKDMDDDGRSSAPKEIPAPPEGYLEWEDNLRVIVDEGEAALLEAWKKSSMPFRQYMTKYCSAQWNDWKAKARKASEVAP